MIKIFTKRSFEFKNSKTEEKVQTTFMGFTSVPDWAANDPMFKAGLRTGSVQIIKDAEQKKAFEKGEDTPKVAELRAQAIELGVPRAAQLGEAKLREGIAKAEEKLRQNGPDLLEEMDEMALRQFAVSNNIDISALAEDATADQLREVIKAAPKG